MGGSFALKARSLGAQVIGFDPDPETVTYALRVRIIDRAVPTLAALVQTSQALVLAAPVDGVIASLGELTRLDAPTVLRLEWIIDVGSVKVPIEIAGSTLPNFLGTHPLAGSEIQGPKGCVVDLFVGRPWAVLPAKRPELQAAVERVICELGAWPLELTAEAHDAIVAAASHTPQTLSSILAATLDAQSLRGLHGSGLASMVRLANSPWSMWRSIYAANAPAIAANLRALRGRMDTIIAALEAGDELPLAELFAQAHTQLEHLRDDDSSASD